MKLRAFIGSSYESFNVANAIKNDLAELDVTLWKIDFFRLSKSNLDNLASQLDDFDLAIFVFADDDEVDVRGKDYLATRDNVVFEYGLFSGRLGTLRNFVVRAKERTLRWLSDLDGLTVAYYDEKLAPTDAAAAVKEACDLIRRELRQTVPRPGIYVDSQRHPLRQDWWTYGDSTQTNTILDAEGIEFSTNDGKQSRLRYPRSDNLNAKGQYCALRLKATTNAGDRRFYIALRNGSDKNFLSMSDSHGTEGWEKNEFMLAVPRLVVGTFQTFLIDLGILKPYLEGPLNVEGVRIGPGIKLSHFCVYEKMPPWLHLVPVLSPRNAPLITIQQPGSPQTVPRRCLVKGTFLHPQKPFPKHTDMQVFVHSPDRYWYPQGNLTLADGKWEVTVAVGNENSGGLEFMIAAVTVEDKPISERVTTLPNALARARVRVTQEK